MSWFAVLHALLKKKPVQLRIRITGIWSHRWVRVLTALASVPILIVCVAAVYYYVSFARMIDARLHGERDRVLPRVFARPFELRRGQSLTEAQLVDRLNEIGYAQRPRPEKPGEFTIGGGSATIIARTPELKGQSIRIVFPKIPPPPKAAPNRPPRPVRVPDRIERLELGTKATDKVVLDEPVLTALINGEREKRRQVALSAIQPLMVQAVLAIEDRRFYEHPGVDPIGMVSAVVRNTFGNKGYLSGASTITQQLARNFFLTDQMAVEQATGRRSIRRKLLEQFMSIVLERRASKDEILELYLNEVYLGQRGSFAIHGVAEGSRLFFWQGRFQRDRLRSSHHRRGDSIACHSFAVYPSGSRPRAPQCRAEGDVGRGISRPTQRERASHEPLQVVATGVDSEAPHFVDYVGQTLASQYPGLTTTTIEAVDVHTTLDLHLQRMAQDALRTGLTHVDELLARRKRRGRAEAALIAVDPKTGEMLAFVGGRSYNLSQYNRAIAARRQPGSVFKPFVYLAAFEQAVADGRTDLTPASIVSDEPQTFEFDDQVWTPENYEQKYDGPITLRRALANSRNLATDSRRAAGRLRSRCRTLEEAWSRKSTQAVSIDRAGRIRSDTVRNRERLHPLPESADDPAAHAHSRHHQRREAGPQEGIDRSPASRACRHDVSRHRHDAQRAQRGHRRRCPVGRFYAGCRGEDRARPTTFATPGSSASRPSC